MLAEFVAAKAVDHLRGEQEPFVLFVACRDDWMVVIMGVDRWMGLVFDELLDLQLVLVQEEGGQSADGHVGDAVVVHVDIGIVGIVSEVLDGAVLIVILEEDERESREARIAFAIGRRPVRDQGVGHAPEEHHCRGWNEPVVVGVVDIAFDGVGVVAAAFRGSNHLSEYALLVAETPQGVGPSQYAVVVGCYDEVFAACVEFVLSVVQEVVVMRLGQHIVVDDQVA